MFSNSSNHLKNILLSKTYEFLSLFIMPLGGGRLAVFNNYNSFKASFVGVIGDITLSSDEDVKLVLENNRCDNNSFPPGVLRYLLTSTFSSFFILIKSFFKKK